ncbi:chemotaxis protein [Helicobacter valdiviensis]|uniref:Chemotaxis protein n=1 Tax=Helicobacter valdiviensis TaxID=1458358 RepID=A0A2W6PL38_9HELI|nr:chemotaxis protein [Helicobacter valdiviensis]PZT47373.1 chemotaxis protein [Helicobacter valdiviensis]
MTQEELDALLNSDISEVTEDVATDTTASKEVQEEQETKITEDGISTDTCVTAKDYKIDQEVSWPPPPPTSEHKVVHQLDDVTRDSEVKATETFDKLEAINNAGMDIEEAIHNLENFISSQEDLLNKLLEKFPNFHTFSQKLEEAKAARESLLQITQATETISNASLEAMDIMQYQDIHRQKIERVINVMRALSRYMSSLFEGKIDDSKRVSSAVHIQGDNTENVVNEDDIEALIANFVK